MGNVQFFVLLKPYSQLESAVNQLFGYYSSISRTSKTCNYSTAELNTQFSISTLPIVSPINLITTINITLTINVINVHRKRIDFFLILKLIDKYNTTYKINKKRTTLQN